MAVEYGPFVPVPPAAKVSWHEMQRGADEWRIRLGLSEGPFEFDLKQQAVRPRGVTGFVRIGDIDFEIAPKFLEGAALEEGSWRRALWEILVAIGEAPYLLASAGAKEEVRALPDALAYAFLDALNAPVSRGLPRDYRETVSWDFVLRGRLRTERLSSLLTHPGRVPVSYDELVSDIPVNRLFRHSLTVLLSEVRSRALLRRLLATSRHFADVQPGPPSPRDIERIRVGRRDRDFQPALDLARLISGGSALEHGGFDQLTRGFLWKSHSVFERFVTLLIERAIRGQSIVLKPQFAQVLATGVEPSDIKLRTLRTRPDIVLLQKGAAVLLDAKYKTWDGRPKPADANQVLVGGSLLGTKAVGLVYPATDASPPWLKWRPADGLGAGPLFAEFVDLTKMAAEGGKEVLESEVAAAIERLFQATSDAPHSVAV